MDTTIFQHKSVETSKAASTLCKRLFPLWSQPPTQGDLQRIILEGWKLNGNEDQIKKAGELWLWARTLMIENTISREEKIAMMNTAVNSAINNVPIHFVTARSPELLHAQIKGQGDPVLPRSHKTVEKMARLAETSSEFLPTIVTFVFADLAIDNLEKIKQACNLEETINENLSRLVEICKLHPKMKFQIIRMSALNHPQGKLGELVDFGGTPKTNVPLNERAIRLIETVCRESAESHQHNLSWTLEQSKRHNQNLAITMGFVGQAIQLLQPPPILIHNEAFIARGALNNLFTDPKNPLPVICLKDLLESKNKKI